MHEHDWQPASERGTAYYSCACGAIGQRVLSGSRRGQIKPRISDESMALSATDPYGRVRLVRNDAHDAKAVHSRMGGHSNFGCDK